MKIIEDNILIKMSEQRLRNILKIVKSKIYSHKNRIYGEYVCDCCNEWVGKKENPNLINKQIQPLVEYKNKIISLLEKYRGV